MSMQQIETVIKQQARLVLKNRGLRNKDILEWTSGTPRVDPEKEVCIKVQAFDMEWSVVVLKECDKR